MKIPELRSPYDKVEGIVYFGCMLDKIRLHGAGELPSEYIAYLGASQGGMRVGKG
jgi:gluconokinase